MEDTCIASSSLTFTQGRGRAHADGQERDPIQQYRKPTARLGCPNTQGTKANKLEPSLEHSAKAVCPGEIPKDYGLEPRTEGERIKEVHLKLTEFPSPHAVSSGLMGSSCRSFCETGIRTRRGPPLEKPRRMEQKYS